MFRTLYSVVFIVLFSTLAHAEEHHDNSHSSHQHGETEMMQLELQELEPAHIDYLEYASKTDSTYLDRVDELRAKTGMTFKAIIEGQHVKPKIEFLYAGASTRRSKSKTKKPSIRLKGEKCLAAAGCKGLKSWGVNRANTMQARCMKGRAILSCHLVGHAWDVSMSNFKAQGDGACSKQRIKSKCGGLFGPGVRFYEGTKRVHIGPGWCASAARLTPPKGWNACFKVKGFTVNGPWDFLKKIASGKIKLW